MIKQYLVFSLLFIFTALQAMSLALQSICDQAVICNNQDAIIQNENLNTLISITSDGGDVLWQVIHNEQTNQIL